MTEEIWTVIRLIKWGTDFFAGKGIESPRLNIELMLCEILNCQRIDIYLQFEKPLNPEELKNLRWMVKRRAEREPLQYILGKTTFYNSELILNNSAIVPRPETEQMIELITNSIDKKKILNILDIGTGSACIAVSLAKFFENSFVTGIDISLKSLDLAKINAELNGVSNIRFDMINILNTTIAEKYDLIVSNPPYIPLNEYKVLEPEVNKYEPGIALTDGKDGLTFYKRFAEIFADMLNDNGLFFLEFGYGQAIEIESIFSSKGFKAKILKDFNGIDRFITNLTEH